MNERTPTSAGSVRPAAGLQGHRVLFLPKNSRTAYFQGLLAEAGKQRDWDIRVVCPEPTRAVWLEAVRGEASFHAVPDFSQRQSWEDDPDRLSEIDAFIGECEQASGVSAARIVLTGERDLGRGFSRPFYYWFHNRIAEQVLADNTEPFRILRRIFAFARQTLQESKPDLVLAGEWADPLCFTFYLAARRMGIRCVVNRPSKLWSGRCYWSEDLYWYNLSANALTAEKRKRGAPVSERARERIEGFRARPTTLGYVRKNWDADDSRGWLSYHGELARLLAYELRHKIQKRGGPQPKPALQLAREHYRRPFLKWRQAGFFRRFDEAQLREMRYIYLACHKDPEQALNGQAFFWTNQYNTVTLLSAALPAGYRLLVREHRRNAGRRPTRYYRDLARLPGVVLVDGFDDQFKYISNADVIVTENGSTGWEGLMLGRRVVTLADNFYQGAELAQRLNNPERVAQAVVELLEEPAVADPQAHDRALGWLLDAEWETTVPIETGDHGETLDLLSALLEGPAVAKAAGDRLSA